METLLEIKNLSGGYNGEEIIKDISMEVKKGDFFGIIGPNGSGKSTLLRMMSRALPFKKGSIGLGGIDISRMDLKGFCRKVAFVPQDTFINFSFSVWEIVLMGRIPHLGRLQNEGQNDFRIAQNALSLTGSLHLKEKDINRLSAGERQCVIIAKALAQEPILLFLDEPTSHLDIGHQIQILDLLRGLSRQKNLTVVIVLHDLNLACEYCNRVILLNDGRIFSKGSPEEVLTYKNIEAVYKTVVVVNKNSVSGKPYITLIPSDYRCPRD